MRKPMVTRTIQTTHAMALCVDTNTATTSKQEVVVPRVYKNEEVMLKAVKAQIETDTLKAVAIIDSWVSEALYGMSEVDFMAHATVIEKNSKEG